jgi:hypothetical protein
MTYRQLALWFATTAIISAVVGAMTSWTMHGGPVQAASYGMEASEFRLVDNTGAIRGRFGLDDEGNTRLLINDAAGTPRLWGGVTADGMAMVTLRDKQGKPRLFMQVDDKEPLVSFRDADDKGRIYLQIKDREPLINLRDKNGLGGIFLQVTDQGPVLWLADEKGVPIFTQR